MFTPKLSCLVRYSIPFCLLWRAILAAPAIVGAEEAVEENEVRTAYLVLIDNSASMSHRPQNPAAQNWSPKMVEVHRQMGQFINSLASGTEVRLFAFSRDFEVGPKVVIQKDEDREQLNKFVTGLKGTGPETRLWRSVDTVLAEAKELAETNPGLRVRVLAYSDAEDNESPVRTDPAKVVAKYQPLLRHAQVQLTYVAIGFELEASLHKTLEEAGVQVREAVRPEDVIPVQADFHVTPTSPLVGKGVLIVDDSLGVIRERSIDWGDGTPASRGRSPRHTYEKPGEYVITLQVVASSGITSTVKRPIRVELPPEPQAAFLVSADAPRVDEVILLINESQGEGLTYQWDFGDGRVSSGRSPRLSYKAPAEYVIRLTVKDRYGRDASLEQTLKVRPLDRPQASIAPPTTVRQGAKARVIDRSTGAITEWQWQVDGVVVSTARDLEWSANEVGAHKGMLTVRGPGGESSAPFVIDVTAPDAPLAAVTIPPVIRRGEKVLVVDRSTGEITARRWQVDGVVASKARDLEWSSSEVGSHQGVLTVQGPGGESSAPFVLEVLGPEAPQASVATPAKLAWGETGRLIDRTTGEVTERQWVIDGKTVSTERDIPWSSQDAGAHEGYLWVRGPGGESRAPFVIDVQSPAAPVANFVVGTSNPRAGQEITLTDLSAPDIEEVRWEFEEGQPPRVVHYEEDTPRSISVTFKSPGPKKIGLHVQGKGGVDRIEREVLVESRHLPPEAHVWTELSGPRGRTRCLFHNESTGSVTRTVYDFGDGTGPVTVEGLKDHEHWYEPGEYTATVHVHGPDEFAPSVVRLPIVVKPPLPRWASHAWWWAPSLLAAAGLGGWQARCWSKRRRERHARMIHGSVLYKEEGASDGDARQIEIVPDSDEVTAMIDEKTRVVVRSRVDGETLIPERTVEVIRDNEVSPPTRLDANEWVRAGGYEFALIST